MSRVIMAQDLPSSQAIIRVAAMALSAITMESDSTCRLHTSISSGRGSPCLFSKSSCATESTH